MNQQDTTIKAGVSGSSSLIHFWRQYFQEVPVCSAPGCGLVASEVDNFFPYIDDFNRCEVHPIQVMVTGWSQISNCTAVHAPARTNRWRRPARTA